MLTSEFLISISIVSYLWQSNINRKLFAIYTEIRKGGSAGKNISYSELNININYLCVFNILHFKLLNCNFSTCTISLLVPTYYFKKNFSIVTLL